ncbi:MAG: hypothetical protein AB7I30_23960 [Isosphaeraceae bacterium]
MASRGERVARRIQRFVDRPVTNLVKGLALLLIGCSEAARTFRDDLNHRHARVGHGLIIIGAFSILAALPRLIETMDAYQRFLLGRSRSDSKGEPG